MIAIDVLRWPGVNQAFIVSIDRRPRVVVRHHPLRQASPRRRALRLGPSGPRGHLSLRCAVPRVRCRARTSGSATPTRTSGGRADKLLVGWGGFLEPQSQGGWNPITLQYEAVRDTVVVLLHVLFFGVYIYLAIWWQKRGDAAAKKQAKALPVSTYGRPLVKKA